ncbi:PKD domain-containing protein [Paenibacillus sp. 5J-6]|uniref:PKD domain-containing protein n=1 Tax=Paenibacillus silvestris TaxID=2606219 RepID=A0A6L8V8V4_9BACL|nr:right-handed parallel beta-helix repeat-containing protein [Paenibacillus silvestris]MZQ86102.1 PKD domain-containing protein [Paenibacillus silvestris]
MSLYVKPYSGMVITEDVIFEPGEYVFSDGLGLIVAGDGISIDGNGAIIRGRGREGNIHTYSGIGLLASGISHVTVKNTTIRGFQTGMKVMNGSNWTILNNDLSYNYSDPDYGWGDGEPFGAIHLESVTHSTIKGNKGNYNWNGLHLKNCEINVIEHNDMSHCTNVCLKLWRSSNNTFSNNNFSYGIRIAPGEVHARDSTSALIESGSNKNRFYANDFTYGGDGVFIRSLNGWVSTDNYFEGNDASYAHNNAWEVWDPGNTFVNNKGNHSSYGFWLGGSCHAVLIGNEAAYNGVRIANAPEPFGNAGIAVVNGSSSHFIMRNNHIHHNKSAGLAIGFKQGYEAYHWIIEQNEITDNDTYGIYMKHAEWINISANVMANNRLGDVHPDVNVKNVAISSETTQKAAPQAKVNLLTSQATAGQPISFTASESVDVEGGALVYRWEMGDGTVQEQPEITHIYENPGFYRVALTVSSGLLSDLAWYDLYVLPHPDTVLLAVDAALTQITHVVPDQFASITQDRDNAVQKGQSVYLRSASTLTRIRLDISTPDRQLFQLNQATQFAFWMKYHHEMWGGFTQDGLKLRFMQDDQNSIHYLCKAPIFNWSKIASEARYGWSYFQVPLVTAADAQTFNESSDTWHVKITGNPQFSKLQNVVIEYSSHGGQFHVWLDEIVFL